ncbi:NUDIX hydrolase [Geotalea sp. SG265]|uniref:NUDIX hydrolase n=1 Tax=Geotalea sp. SG265 TaxID=2922867 RepID=UPI001FB0237E|nr:NUDIX hydrolase [Geotalea sp. SG265]
MEKQKQTVVVTCLIRNEAAEILLVRHVRRGWELPQGRVEEGESLTEAVHREVLEETGTCIELGPLAVVWSKVCLPPATIFGYSGRYLNGALTPSDETQEVSWFSAEEALGLVTHQVNRDRLQALLQQGDRLIHRAYRTRPFVLLEPTEAEKVSLKAMQALVF